MQRRLAVALVLTALISVLLVGFGMVVISQFGARSRAEDDVTRALNVMEAALQSTSRSSLEIESLLVSTRRDLGLRLLEAVVITDQGEIRSLVAPQRRRGAPRLIDFPALTLSAEEVQAIGGGETITVAEPGSVYAVRSVPTGVTADAPNLRVGLLAGQQVTGVDRQVVAWFLLSSLIVLIGALAAGLQLARRLARPIRDIQDATAAIAAD